MTHRPANPHTIAARTGVDTDTAHGTVMPPLYLYLSSNYSFAGFDQKRRYDYSRSGNPTCDVLAETLAELEGGAGAVITATGMAAVDLPLSILEPGDLLIAPLLRLVESRPDAGALVIACYSDPGLDAVRSVTRTPAFGIQESGVLAAMARGDRFGVVAISDGSVARHRRYMRRMGVLDRCAGDRALNISAVSYTHLDAADE